jgi:pimeloyl-ACP methyl ester carboxylesterase
VVFDLLWPAWGGGLGLGLVWACPGHPRLYSPDGRKTRVPSDKPGHDADNLAIAWSQMALTSSATSTFITAPDGLRLHARCYGHRSSPAAPVVCLPGLARTTADFEVLASALTNNSPHPRRVIAIDSRGRGLSDYDRDPANYSLPVELADVLAVVTALETLPAVFIGTSRGGILTMLLAAVRPTAIAAAVLNDIGPVIEPQGLMRIKSYVGKLPQPRTYEEGAEILRRLFGAQFPKLGQADWLAGAHRTFKEEKGRLVPTYDVRIANAMNGVDAGRPLPPLWKEFDALVNVPMMVIRGANSDLLSAATVETMRARHPALETIEIPDQGHAPLLTEADTIARIVDFVNRCDAT